MFSLGMRTVESEFKITERNEDIQNMIFNISKKRKEWMLDNP